MTTLTARISRLALATGLLGSMPAFAQDVPAPASSAEREALPAAGELFAKHVESIGGEQAVRAHTNRVHRGRLRGPTSFALLTTWHEAPDKIRLRYESPGQPLVDTVFNGEYGWRVRDAKNPQLLRNEMLRQLRDDADFFADLEPQKRYKTLETIGRVELDGDKTEAYVVRATFAYGKIELHYFDVDSGRRVAARTSNKAGDQVIPVTVVYRDYREVSGVMLPHEISITTNPGEENAQSTQVTFSEIKANVASVPSWELPAELGDQIKQIERAGGGSGG